MNTNYTELISLRRITGDALPLCADHAVKMSEQVAVYPIVEFYPGSCKPTSLQNFEKAVDEVIKYVGQDVTTGDCLVYGTTEIKWAMLAMHFIPPVLAAMPRKEIPGRRMFFVMLPDTLNKDYLSQCLDKL